MGVRILCQHVLEHRAVQAQIGDQLLQFPALLLELVQAPELRGGEPAVLLAPVASVTPILRQTSTTVLPGSRCFSAKALWPSVKRLLFTA